MGRLLEGLVGTPAGHPDRRTDDATGAHHVVVRPSCDELVGALERLVPAALAVAVVRDLSFEPLDRPAGSKAARHAETLLVQPGSGDAIPEVILGGGQVDVRPQHFRGVEPRSELDRLLEITEPAGVADDDPGRPEADEHVEAQPLEPERVGGDKRLPGPCDRRVAAVGKHLEASQLRQHVGGRGRGGKTVDQLLGPFEVTQRLVAARHPPGEIREQDLGLGGELDLVLGEERGRCFRDRLGARVAADEEGAAAGEQHIAPLRIIGGPAVQRRLVEADRRLERVECVGAVAGLAERNPSALGELPAR